MILDLEKVPKNPRPSNCFFAYGSSKWYEHKILARSLVANWSSSRFSRWIWFSYARISSICHCIWGSNFIFIGSFDGAEVLVCACWRYLFSLFMFQALMLGLISLYGVILGMYLNQIIWLDTHKNIFVSSKKCVIGSVNLVFLSRAEIIICHLARGKKNWLATGICTRKWG